VGTESSIRVNGGMKRDRPEPRSCRNKAGEGGICRPRKDGFHLKGCENGWLGASWAKDTLVLNMWVAWTIPLFFFFVENGVRVGLRMS